MSSVFCRRQFLSHAALLAGAALLLPARRLAAAAESTDGAVGSANQADEPILVLVGRYGEIVATDTGAETTRITARIRCFDSMQSALSGGRSHGIGRVRSRGNVVAFEHGGRRYEIAHLVHAA